MSQQLSQILPYLAQNFADSPFGSFMIGSRIQENPRLFQQALAMGGELAVHTWAHPLLTTQTDMGILGELGWCMRWSTRLHNRSLY